MRLQGRLLPTPELVPFRLTQDFVAALGVTGVHGPYTKCSEITMSVLRANLSALLVVLEVFLHDPLYDWALSPGKQIALQEAAGDAGSVLGASTTVSNADGGLTVFSPVPVRIFWPPVVSTAALRLHRFAVRRLWVPVCPSKTQRASRRGMTMLCACSSASSTSCRCVAPAQRVLLPVAQPHACFLHTVRRAVSIRTASSCPCLLRSDA